MPMGHVLHDPRHPEWSLADQCELSLSDVVPGSLAAVLAFEKPDPLFRPDVHHAVE